MRHSIRIQNVLLRASRNRVAMCSLFSCLLTQSIDLDASQQEGGDRSYIHYRRTQTIKLT